MLKTARLIKVLGCASLEIIIVRMIIVVQIVKGTGIMITFELATGIIEELVVLVLLFVMFGGIMQIPELGIISGGHWLRQYC
jgi:hypothetical protein